MVFHNSLLAAEFVCDDKTGKNRRKIGKFRRAT